MCLFFHMLAEPYLTMPTAQGGVVVLFSFTTRSPRCRGQPRNTLLPPPARLVMPRWTVLGSQTLKHLWDFGYTIPDKGAKAGAPSDQMTRRREGAGIHLPSLSPRLLLPLTRAQALRQTIRRTCAKDDPEGGTTAFLLQIRLGFGGRPRPGCEGRRSAPLRPIAA